MLRYVVGYIVPGILGNHCFFVFSIKLSDLRAFERSRTD